MICDIIERINIKKVDECLDSEVHLESNYLTMHPNAERMFCHLFHVKGPKYNNAFYITDMICEMILHPSDIKRLWSEMSKTLKRRASSTTIVQHPVIAKKLSGKGNARITRQHIRDTKSINPIKRIKARYALSAMMKGK